jgi:hypothetical protein
MLGSDALFSQVSYRESTGLENPGKSLNGKKFQDWKVLENQ